MRERADNGPSETIVPDQTALLVMHYQTDVLKQIPEAAPTLVANARALCDAARSASVAIYFVQIRFSPGHPEVSPLNKIGQALKKANLFINDTIAPGLEPQEDDCLIIGHRGSAFFGTGLQARLTEAGINTLILAGISSTGVVLSTVAYASDADFRLFTVKDCCYDPDPIVHDRLFSTAFESRTHVLTLASAKNLLA